jgi:predicted nucleic acid-binding Zn ribbon protein
MAIPEKIDSVLSSYLSKRGYYSYVKEYIAISHWKEIVGEEISSISKCIGIENNVLYVAIDSAPWRQEISFLKKDILNKIKFVSQCNTIKDIVFI